MGILATSFNQSTDLMRVSGSCIFGAILEKRTSSSTRLTMHLISCLKSLEKRLR